MSDAKVALGCRLFFETRLSVTNTYSCASCHHPELAFTDGRALAVGAKGDTIHRGAMTLTNVAYNPAFTWASSSVTTLERQMEQPLFNEHPLEMGLKRDDRALLEWFEQQEKYAAAFKQSFPQEAEPITMPNVLKAIASYERTLISGRSAFDRYVYDDDRAAFSEGARRGMKLFYSERSGCSHCHFGVNFSGSIAQRGKPRPRALFANNGSAVKADEGLYAQTKQSQDRGRFRVPTLRNIDKTKKEAKGVVIIVFWLFWRVSTVNSRCISSWSVPKAAIDPKNPFKTAIQMIFGSFMNFVKKFGSWREGPQFQR